MPVFSPNMLKTFQQCPKKYAFRYVKNLSMPVNDEIFETGKNIHALASYYLRKENIDRLEKSLTQSEASLWKYLKGIKYFTYECLHTEYSLIVNIDGDYFGGRLDALVKDGGKYYILDYKTGATPSNPTYDFQTMIYLLAVSEFYKTTDIVFVYINLKNKKETEIQLTDSLIKEYKQKLAQMAKTIDKGDFTPSKKDCKNCEFRKICYDKILD